MAVRQKRRIYDITNVLEGIGLIEKKSKNSIQWRFVFITFLFVFILFHVVYYRGAGPGCNTQEIGEKLAQLRNEVASLDSLERNLDQHKQVNSQFLSYMVHKLTMLS